MDYGNTSDFLRRDRPGIMEIRVIERDGRLWLQQYRNVGMHHEYDWVDVAEMPAGSKVVPLRPRTSK